MRGFGLAAFLPRPFVAGAASMTYATFAMYNVLGGALWVLICVGAGYMFGNIAVVKENFELVVIGIIAVSVLPMVVEVIRQWQAGPAAEKR